MCYSYTNGFAGDLNMNLALAAYLHEDFSNVAEFHVCQMAKNYYQTFVVSETYLSKKLIATINFQINYFYFNVNEYSPLNTKKR